MTNERKFNVQLFVLLILVSFCSLLFCTKNSWLYSFNDWVDGNAFFTMGKGMVNGLVPYKDLFEQKGPLLYLIYGIGYLLSNKTLHGIFVLEVISMAITCYYIFKFSNKFLNRFNSLVVCFLFIPVVCSSKSFVQGGSCEEFCLPFFAYSIYSFYELLNEESTQYQYKLIFLTGLNAGLVTLMKFNLIAFWFIWMALAFFFLLSKKKIKEAFIACVVFLVGMFLPLAVFSIYFMIHGAFKDFIESYFMFNMNSYTTILSLRERIHNMLWACYSELNYNYDIKYLTYIGFACILCTWIYRNVWFILFMILSYAFLVLGVFFGGNAFFYYYLDFQIYIVFGLIGILKLFELLLKNNKIKKLYYRVMLCFVALLTVQNVHASTNLEYMPIKKDYYAQYVFDQIISKSDDKTLLNYDNLDGGFYTASDILPNVKYFMRQNVDYERYPIIMDSQNDYIKSKKVKYVVIREYFGNRGCRKDLENLNKNYKCIKHHAQIFEGMDYDYYLYERR